MYDLLLGHGKECGLLNEGHWRVWQRPLVIAQYPFFPSIRLITVQNKTIFTGQTATIGCRQVTKFWLMRLSGTYSF